MSKTDQVPKQRRSAGEYCYEDRLFYNSVLEKDLPIKSNTHGSLNKNLEDKLLQSQMKMPCCLRQLRLRMQEEGSWEEASEATRMTAFRQ